MRLRSHVRGALWSTGRSRVLDKRAEHRDILLIARATHGSAHRGPSDVRPDGDGRPAEAPGRVIHSNGRHRLPGKGGSALAPPALRATRRTSKGRAGTLLLGGAGTSFSFSA